MELQGLPEKYIPVLKQKQPVIYQELRKAEIANDIDAEAGRISVLSSYHTNSASSKRTHARPQPSRRFSSIGKSLLALALVPAILLTITLAGRGSSTTIRVPDKDNDEFYYELLDLVLEKGAPAEKVVVKRVKVEGNQLVALSDKEDQVDLSWMMTDTTREAFTRPVKIPLTSGLLSYRICMVSKDDPDILNGVETIEGFRSYFSVGQGRVWPDTRILRDARIEVEGFDDIEKIIPSLKAGDIDCYARGVSEIWAEVESRADLTADKYIYFKYNSPVYFFAKHDEKRLQEIIEKGLKATRKDGTYCELLMEHYGDDIRNSNLSERTQIELENKDLPPGTSDKYDLNFDSEEYPESKGECRVLRQ